MKTPVKTFRDFIAWQGAMDLVVSVYENARMLPKEEQYGLGAQMRRAAVSVSSNLAEGFGRRSRPDYARFIQIALGSLFELQTQIDIARRLKYIENEKMEQLASLSRKVEYLLSRLRLKMLASAAQTR